MIKQAPMMVEMTAMNRYRKNLGTTLTLPPLTLPAKPARRSKTNTTVTKKELMTTAGNAKNAPKIRKRFKKEAMKLALHATHHPVTTNQSHSLHVPRKLPPAEPQTQRSVRLGTGSHKKFQKNF